MRFLLAVLCLLSLAALCSADPKLVHLQTLYRHGDRTPTGTYKNDPYQQSFWGLPWGELTTWGMQQHWTQGKKIKARYTDQLKFLNATYSSTQVSVRSVESPRCLVSALSNIAATYTDSKDTFPNVQGWPSNWTPIPIATYLEKTDHIINSDAECLRLDELYVERVAKKGFIEFIMSKAGLLTTITQGAGESIADIKGLKNFFDAVYIEKVCYNLTLPAWITDDLFNEAEDTLMQGEDYVYGLDGFDEPENTEIIMLRGGGLLAEMIANMQSVISGSGRLYHAYSSHDTMVSAFLNALGAKRGAIGPKNPDYASTVAVELWKDDGGKYLVKLWYSDNALTDLRDITKYISGCGGGDYCSWDDFVARSQQYVHTDIEKQCNKL